MVIGEGAVAVLSGALLGDALGRPFVGLKPGRVEQLLRGNRPEGFLSNPLIMPDRPEKNMLPGLHGAVGQRLLGAVAALQDDPSGRGVVALAGSEMMAFAGQGIAPEGSLGYWREPGRPLRRTLERWAGEYPWEAADFATKDQESEGATVATLGALGAVDSITATTLEGLVGLTHSRLLPFSAALAVMEAVRLMRDQAGSRRLDGEGVARELIRRLEPQEEALIAFRLKAWKELGWGRPPLRLVDYLAPLPSLVREGRDDLAIKTILATAGEQHPDGMAPSHPQHGFAGALIPWALYRGFGGLSARLAIEDVLVRGGESSTVASVVASLRVARQGMECLPDEWWAGLRGRTALDALCREQLEETIRRWHAMESGGNQAEDRLREPLREAVRKQQALEEERARNHPSPPRVKAQEEAPFPPPPHLWLREGEEEDPKKKKIMRALRGKKRIDWKEERHNRGRDEASDEE